MSDLNTVYPINPADNAPLLPTGSTALERYIAGQCSRLSAIPRPLRALWSADDCPLALLPWLAWALRIDYWDAKWHEAKKRDIIRAAMPFNAQRGTRAGLLNALQYAPVSTALKMWYEQQPQGIPYSFVVTVPNNTLSIDDLAQLNAIVAPSKSARDLFAVQATITSVGHSFVVGTGKSGEHISLLTI